MSFLSPWWSSYHVVIYAAAKSAVTPCTHARCAAATSLSASAFTKAEPVQDLVWPPMHFHLFRKSLQLRYSHDAWSPRLWFPTLNQEPINQEYFKWERRLATRYQVTELYAFHLVRIKFQQIINSSGCHVIYLHYFNTCAFLCLVCAFPKYWLWLLKKIHPHDVELYPLLNFFPISHACDLWLKAPVNIFP